MSDRNHEDDVVKYGEEKAKKIRELQAVIAAELQKDESETDIDLINECVDWCLELKGITVEPTDEELQAMYDRCVAGARLPEQHPARSFKRTVIAILPLRFSLRRCVSPQSAYGVRLIHLSITSRTYSISTQGMSFQHPKAI